MIIEASTRGNEMFKVSKQSLRDWQITKDGKSFAWVTKADGLYSLTFREFGKNVPYTFQYFKEATDFAKNLG